MPKKYNIANWQPLLCSMLDLLKKKKKANNNIIKRVSIPGTNVLNRIQQTG